MTNLRARLSAALADAVTVIDSDDDGLTVGHEGTVASLRVVMIADGLELVSLTQPLAWDLPLTNKTRENVAKQASATMLGTVVLVEKLVEAPVNGTSAKAGRRAAPAKKAADVLLRYNFPAAGLTDHALRTLILMVLAAGRDVRDALAPT